MDKMVDDDEKKRSWGRERTLSEQFTNYTRCINVSIQTLHCIRMLET